MFEAAITLEVRHLGHVPLSSALVETRSLKVRVAVAQAAGPGLRVVEGLRGPMGVSQRQGRGEEERQHTLELHAEQQK